MLSQRMMENIVYQNVWELESLKKRCQLYLRKTVAQVTSKCKNFDSCLTFSSSHMTVELVFPFSFWTLNSALLRDQTELSSTAT